MGGVGSKGFEFVRGGEGAEGEGGGMGFEFVRGGEGEVWVELSYEAK